MLKTFATGMALMAILIVGFALLLCGLFVMMAAGLHLVGNGLGVVGGLFVGLLLLGGVIQVIEKRVR